DLPEPLAAAFGAVLEGVAQGHDADAPGGVEDVIGGARTPAATADQADLDRVAARCPGVARQCLGRQGAGRGGGRLEEVAPRGAAVTAHGSAPEEGGGNCLILVDARVTCS